MDDWRAAIGYARSLAQVDPQRLACEAVVDVLDDDPAVPAIKSLATDRCHPAEEAKCWKRSVDIRP